MLTHLGLVPVVVSDDLDCGEALHAVLGRDFLVVLLSGVHLCQGDALRLEASGGLREDNAEDVSLVGACLQVPALDRPAARDTVPALALRIKPEQARGRRQRCRNNLETTVGS